MKKIILICSVILNVVLCLLLWQRSKPRLATADGLLKDECFACPDNCYKPVCDTSQPFPKELALEMVRNYRDHHWQTINSNCFPFAGFNRQTPGDPVNNQAQVDSRCVWFDMDTLKKFIHTVELYSCNSSIPDLKLGIRIYYAEYPGTAEALQRYNITRSDYTNLHTVLMVPTFHRSGIDIDFNPFMVEKYRIPVPLDSPGGVGPDPLILSPMIAQNHGGLAPPPDDCNIYWNEGLAFLKYVVDRDYSMPATACEPLPCPCPPTGH